MIAADLNGRTWNSKATRTNRRSLCSKLCETAPDDSYRGGIPRARVRQTVRTHGESRGFSSADDVMGYSRPANRRRAAGRRGSAVPRRSITRRYRRDMGVYLTAAPECS